MLRKRLNADGKNIGDRYFSRFQYVEAFASPVLMYDYFLLELVNIVGYVLNSYNRYGNINKVGIYPLLKKVIQRAHEFYSYRKGCLDNPFSTVNFDKLRERGIIEWFPAELQ